MRRKKELEKGIIIEDDLTRKEREIQNRLRAWRGRKERKGTIAQG